jgi:hypothetical protein
MRKGPATSSLANSSTPAETTAPSGKDGAESGTSTAKGKDDWDDNW